MEETMMLKESSVHRRKRVTSQSRALYGTDDESSTDSGCSSRGSSESNDRLSSRESGPSESPRGYLQCLRRDNRQSSPSSSQEGLPNGEGNNRSSHHKSHSKVSRSWSPSRERFNHHERHHWHHHSRDSSYSTSDGNSSSSNSNSSKRTSRIDVVRRAFQSIKIAMRSENGHKQHNSESNNNEDSYKNANTDSKQSKKSPRRILRSPVSYTYVKGLSGLPTQRVPRKSAQHTITPNNYYL